jgi:hypothetical protein
MPDQDLLQPQTVGNENASRLLGRVAVQFGVGAGLLCGLWVLGLQLSGNNAFGPKRLIAYFAVPLLVVASQWRLKQALAPLKTGFLRAWAVGTMTAVVAATVTALAVLGVGELAGPAAMERNRQELLSIAKVERANIEKLSGKAGYEAQLTYLGRISVDDIALNDFRTLLLAAFLALPGAVFFRE